jgi:hypothetical protein
MRQSVTVEDATNHTKRLMVVDFDNHGCSISFPGNADESIVLDLSDDNLSILTVDETDSEPIKIGNIEIDQ